MTDGYYPKVMTKISEGLYIFKFILPSGGTAVGSYLVDVSYKSSDTNQLKQTLYQIVVTAPFGIYSVTTY